MLSQKARYAIHALLALAGGEGLPPLVTAEIAQTSRVPKKFLEQILLDLKRRGMVYSVRGRQGGYALSRRPDQISLAEVIRTIDGPLALSPCASRTAYRKCSDCSDEGRCRMRQVLIDVRDATAAILENRTLADLVPQTRSSHRSRRRVA